VRTIEPDSNPVAAEWVAEHNETLSPDTEFRVIDGRRRIADLLVQGAGLCALAGDVAAGYWRWIKPREAALDLAGKGLLLLIVVTLMGGLIGSVG
jgi:hypothetical protein